MVDSLRHRLGSLLGCTLLLFLFIFPSTTAFFNIGFSKNDMSNEWADELTQQISKEDYVVLINLCNRTLSEGDMIMHGQVKPMYFTVDTVANETHITRGSDAHVTPSVVVWVTQDAVTELTECGGRQAFLLKLYNIYMHPRAGVKLSFQIDPGFQSHLDVQLIREVLSALKSTQWKYATGGWVRSSPSLADINNDGKLEVLVGSSDTNLYCLSPYGSLLWKYKTDGIVESSPSIADIDEDGELDVVVTSDDNSVYVLSKDGLLKWRFTADGKISASPVVTDIDGDGHLEVIFGSYDNRLYCLSHEGALKWNFTTEGRIVSSPTIGNLDGEGLSEIVFGSDDKHVYALNMGGEQLWKFETGSWVGSSAAIADLDDDGLVEVVIGSDDGKLYCLSYDGQLKWSYSTSREITQAVSIADVDGDGNLEIVFSSLDKNVYCLNPSGLLKWNYGLPHSITSSFAIADIDGDGKLEILGGSIDNNLYCLGGDGVFEWAYPTDLYVTSTPAVADIDSDGKLEVVFGSSDNNIYCLEEGFGEGLPWPTFQHDLHHTGSFGNNAPICAVTYPNGGETVSGTIDVCASAFDQNLGDKVVSVTFEYSCDLGSTWHEIGVDTSSPWSVSWDTTEVSDGVLEYLVGARAFDGKAYSRWVQSDYYFSIDNYPNQPPVADAGGPYSVRIGRAVSFDGTGSSDPDGTIVSYAWNFGDGTFGTGATPTHMYAGVGSYTVILTVTDNEGATGLDTTVATVMPGVTGPSIDYVMTTDYVEIDWGEYGDTIVVLGSGVTAGVELDFGWDGLMSWDGEKGILNSTIGKADGSYEVWFDVPQAVNGPHYLWARDKETGETVRWERAFNVAPHIELSSLFGIQGEEIYIAGYGFVGDDYVVLKLGEVHVSIFKTDMLGGFSGSFTIPALQSGDYKLKAEQTPYGISVERDFRIGLMIVILSPSSGPVGTEVTLSGTGFTKGGAWKATLGDITIVEDGTVDLNGILKLNGGVPTFHVPAMEPGIYTLTVLDIETNIEIEVEFEVTCTRTTVSTDKASYLPDELVSISGVAEVDALVAIDVKNPLGASIYIDIVQADGLGAYDTKFRLATDAMTGTYTVWASAAGKTASTTFIVEETGTLSIDTTPVKGEVFVDGVSWGDAPASKVVDIGTYNVTFGDVEGYVTPDSVEAIVAADETTEVLGTYVLIPELPAETSNEETLDSTGAPKTSFVLGETVLASAEVTNVGIESQPMLIVVQLTDPDYRALPPSYISVTLPPGQSLGPSLGFALPLTGYTAGTWTAKVMVLDMWPALGGVPIAAPVTMAFTVTS